MRHIRTLARRWQRHCAGRCGRQRCSFRPHHGGLCAYFDGHSTLVEFRPVP